METVNGKVQQVLGPVIDMSFDNGFVPNIKSAVKFDINGTTQVAEVALHLGEGLVRCVAMGATEGIARGLDVYTENIPIIFFILLLLVVIYKHITNYYCLTRNIVI